MSIIRRVVAGLAVAAAVASLAACSSTPKPGGDFCAVYTSAKSQMQDATTWVDSQGNINLVKAATGAAQLITTLGKLDAAAPPDVKGDLDTLVPVYNDLKSAVLSGDASKIQSAVTKLSDPKVQQAMTDAMNKAAKDCS